MSLVLRELMLKDEKPFKDMLEEWDDSEGFNMLFGLVSEMSFQSYLELQHDIKQDSKASPYHVPVTSLFGFVGNEIVGKVSVRHSLNDYFKLLGGHIGYGVLARHRNQGYATKMLRDSLPYCRSLGLSKVLIICDEKNEASIKVIEKNGGVFDRFYDPKKGGSLKQHYWISL